MRPGCLFLLLWPAAGAFAVPPVCPSVPSERYAPRTFLGYACRRECDQHKAGFAWAVRWGVSDPRLCAALGGARAEGCRAGAEEQMSPEEAGERWARENEITARCDCDGAGPGFATGCRRALVLPPPHEPR